MQEPDLRQEPEQRKRQDPQNERGQEAAHHQNPDHARHHQQVVADLAVEPLEGYRFFAGWAQIVSFADDHLTGLMDSTVTFQFWPLSKVRIPNPM